MKFQVTTVTRTSHFLLFGIWVHVPHFDFERLLPWHPPCLQRPWLWGMRCRERIFTAQSLLTSLFTRSPASFSLHLTIKWEVHSQRQTWGLISSWYPWAAPLLPQDDKCGARPRLVSYLSTVSVKELNSFKDLKYWEGTSIFVVTVNHNFVNLA